MAKRRADPEPPVDEVEGTEDEEGQAPAGPKVIVSKRFRNTRKGFPAVTAFPLPAIGEEVKFTIDGVTFQGVVAAHELIVDDEMAVFDSLTQVKAEE